MHVLCRVWDTMIVLVLVHTADRYSTSKGNVRVARSMQERGGDGVRVLPEKQTVIGRDVPGDGRKHL